MANQGKPNSFHILAPFFLFVLCTLAQDASQKLKAMVEKARHGKPQPQQEG